MGVSRSASTVIAYAMKEYGWNLDRAYDYVKERRTVTKPNPSFMRQLEEYQGILLARWVQGLILIIHVEVDGHNTSMVDSVFLVRACIAVLCKLGFFGKVALCFQG